MRSPVPDAVAIDFGTSNSAAGLPLDDGEVRLVALEDGRTTMPTAVFYRADTPAARREPDRLVGRAALAAYVDGQDGRLMRSMKSVLGSTLATQSTDVGGGRSLRYVDVVAGYLRHLKVAAEAEAGRPLTRAVLGRPVFFVDDDAARDAQAEAALRDAARAVGFAEVAFQFEPIAAALDHERAVGTEQLLLVADIGGGTSDFSVLRVGPARRGRADRRDDILANHGVHVAGTDFDRHVSLAAVMPLLGLGGRGPARAGQPPREIPSGIYFDLATWHLINTCYAPARVAEQRTLKSWFADPAQHRRLMTVLTERLGHGLAAAAEAAKIELSTAPSAVLALDAVEAGLRTVLDAARARAALADDMARIVAAAAEAVRRAGVRPGAVDALYFTGGSTGLAPLVQAIAAQFPSAARVQGDRFASVARGLAVHAGMLFR